MMARSIPRIGVVIGAVIMAVSASIVAAPPAAEQVIRRGVDDVLDVLRDPATQPAAARAQRIARLRQVADRLFDWPEMSQRSLGPAWRTLDPAQRKRFAEVFPDILASAYLDDLDKFRGDERVTIERSTESGDNAEVHTIVVTHSGERVPMVYWLHRVESAWRVYDFSIEGVSLVNHYRESFSRFLVNHKFEELMERLEQKRPKPAGAAAM
jgi:phospholipid transport system substrate-binding protein